MRCALSLKDLRQWEQMILIRSVMRSPRQMGWNVRMNWYRMLDRRRPAARAARGYRYRCRAGGRSPIRRFGADHPKGFAARQKPDEAIALPGGCCHFHLHVESPAEPTAGPALPGPRER